MKAQGARDHQLGFVITIELILIATILVIGSLAGLVAIRDALTKRLAHRQAAEMTVYDANATPLGKVLGFDEHEAPLVPFVDRTVPPLSPDPNHRNYRTLIGIRDDRFTSREAVYYASDNCTGTPCIKGPSDEDVDSVGYNGQGAAGVTSYLHALQYGPNYAVGRSPDGIQGYLYRETAAACPVAPDDIRSRYISQKVVSGTPCETINVAGSGASNTSAGQQTPAYTECLAANYSVSLGGGLSQCGCPSGYSSQSDVIDAADADIQDAIGVGLKKVGKRADGLPTVPVGEICCVEGSTLSDANLPDTVAFTLLAAGLELLLGVDSKDFEKAMKELGKVLEPVELVCISDGGSSNPPVTGAGYPRSLDLRLAEPVPNPANSAENAFARFVAPFQVNLPPDTGDDSWFSTPPDGEGRGP